MSDESQENVRKMRELLAKSQAPKGNAEQVRHVTADRGGIAVHAGGSVHIGMSPVAQRKPFFNFGRLLSLYSLLLFSPTSDLGWSPSGEASRKSSHRCSGCTTLASKCRLGSCWSYLSSRQQSQLALLR